MIGNARSMGGDSDSPSDASSTGVLTLTSSSAKNNSIASCRPYLRPHLLQEPSSDKYTRYLHAKLPESVQTYIRDQGVFRFMFDKSVNGIAFIKALTDTNATSNYMAISNKLKTIRYGASDYHIFEYFNIADTYSSPNATGGGNPVNNVERRVLVFVHGGAWGSGRPWMYRLTAAHAAASLGCSDVCIVGYPVYPDCNIGNQVDALIDAVGSLSHFLHTNLNIHPGTYVMMGHSSGANISALALIKMARSKRKIIDHFVALAGVYDIERHYIWERSRGVHLISPMAAAAVDHRSASPIHELNLLQYTGADVGIDMSRFFPHTLLIHGIDDNTVPVLESIELSKSLMRLGVDTSTSFPTYDHMDPITDLVDSNLYKTSLTGLSLRYYKENRMDKCREKQKDSSVLSFKSKL